MLSELHKEQIRRAWDISVSQGIGDELRDAGPHKVADLLVAMGQGFGGGDSPLIDAIVANRAEVEQYLAQLMGTF